MDQHVAVVVAHAVGVAHLLTGELELLAEVEIEHAIREVAPVLGHQTRGEILEHEIERGPRRSGAAGLVAEETTRHRHEGIASVHVILEEGLQHLELAPGQAALAILVALRSAPAAAEPRGREARFTHEDHRRLDHGAVHAPASAVTAQRVGT